MVTRSLTSCSPSKHGPASGRSNLSAWTSNNLSVYTRVHENHGTRKYNSLACKGDSTFGVALSVNMTKSCKGLAQELVKCLSESDCVKVEGRSMRDCVGEHEPSVPSKCAGLRETYYDCKRMQLNMSSRIRGNKGY